VKRKWKAGEGLQDDNALMVLAQQGNQCAYETIVLRYRAEAVRFAEGLLHDSYAAEDAVQEAFARLYVHRMDYHPNSSFKAYLYATVRNQCLDFLRQQRAKPVVELDEEAVFADSNDLENLLESRQQTQNTTSALSVLPENFRVPLLLFAQENMSYAEIAQLLGKTQAQIKITIYRARKKLKKLMEQEDTQ
jgi:RNA polymerase sigma-70 factor (ECF subfamily)